MKSSCSRRGYGAKDLGTMLWLLLTARYEAGEHPAFGRLCVGELVVTKPALARELRLTEKEIRSILRRLELDEFIVVDGQAKAGTKVRIVNFAQYQGIGSKGQKQTTTESTSNEDALPINCESEKSSVGNCRKIAEKLPIKGQKQTTTESTSNEDALPIEGPINCRKVADKTYYSYKERKNLKIALENNTRARETSDENYSDATFAPYPKSPHEVVSEATRQGIVMTEEQARDFIEEFAAVGWINKYGQKITQWRYLLRRWINSPAAKIAQQRLINEQLRGKRETAYLDAARQPREKSITEKQKEWASGKFSGDYSQMQDDPAFAQLGKQQQQPNGDKK
ncbi:MAG: hypothetical protein J5654_09530 [Victivallales bacterium]|nr:hypothetical protein [Victivallales bacterium]